MSPARPRAEQCGYLARGTNASVRSVSVRVLPDWHHAAVVIYFQTVYRRQPVRAKRVLVASQTNLPRLTPRLKPSANLNVWKARKTFNDLRRPTRARGSERAAVKNLS